MRAQSRAATGRNPMSNPYRNLEAFEREVRRRNIIEAAILDDVNMSSKICRHSELERLQKDANTMRAKGERPTRTITTTGARILP